MERHIRFRYPQACGLRRSALPAVLLGLLLAAACPKANHPPDAPGTPVGISYGLADSTYEFSVAATNPDGESLAIQMSWGDSTPQAWSGMVASNETITWRKSWPNLGAYNVRAQARDMRGALSDWSADHAVQILAADSFPVPPSMPLGPDSVQVGFLYEYSTILNGPPGENLELNYDPSYLFPYDVVGAHSGDTVKGRGFWWTAGTTELRAEVTDEATTRETAWSAPHQITALASPVGGWERPYGSRWIHGIAPTADGGVVMTGTSDSGAFLARADTAGTLQWWELLGDSTAEAASVVQTADLGYVVVAYHVTHGEWFGVSIIRTDAEGNVVWRRSYYDDPLSSVGAEQIRQTPDGGYVIAARSVVMRTDSAGDSIWAQGIPATAVELTPDGQILVGGGGYWSVMRLTRMDLLGNVIWQKDFDRQLVVPHAIRRTGSGAYFVCGENNLEADGFPAYLAKVDETGGLVWEHYFPGLDGASGFDVAPLDDGGCYMVGVGGGVYIVRTDPDGNPLWQRLLLGTSDDAAGYSAIRAPDGGCIIGGYEERVGAALFKVDQHGYAGPLGLSSPAPRRPEAAVRTRCGSGILSATIPQELRQR